MCKYFNLFIFAILAAGVQDAYGNLGVNSQQVVLNRSDKDFSDFDILNVIIEGETKNNEHHKQIIVYINEKSLIVDSYDNGIAFSLNSLKPTNNGAWTPSSSWRNKVFEFKDKENPYFDILNITINKINNVRSEKIIKIFINDKIVGMNTRGNGIDLYIQHRKDENTNNFIQQFSLDDSNGSTNSVQYAARGPHTVYYNPDQSTEKNKGNNSDIKKANWFILLCFVLWHLLP